MNINYKDMELAAADLNNNEQESTLKFELNANESAIQAIFRL